MQFFLINIIFEGKNLVYFSVSIKSSINIFTSDLKQMACAYSTYYSLTKFQGDEIPIVYSASSLVDPLFHTCTFCIIFASLSCILHLPFVFIPFHSQEQRTTLLQ